MYKTKFYWFLNHRRGFRGYWVCCNHEFFGSKMMISKNEQKNGNFEKTEKKMCKSAGLSEAIFRLFPKVRGILQKLPQVKELFFTKNPIF